ncbi:hypothetical protein BKA70DRAFT_1122228, partial [Coprinopsis sp. MPI-PUGE-AT-0042]
MSALPDEDAHELYSLQQQIAEDCTLNLEQRRAFHLITDDFINRRRGVNGVKPLKLFMGGPGGTGKSTVIKAVRSFFGELQCEDQLRCCAFTGVAARNIDGMTLHSALNL